MRDNGIPLPEEFRDGSGRKRVLVVDDEPSIRDIFAESLSRRSVPYDVMTAADGFEAGRLVATFRPDVVLLDLRMPGLDGFQVCRTIKADSETAAIVVIAMTGYHTAETESRILDCGAVRCLSKPIEPSAVAAVIDTTLEQSSTTKRRRRPAGA